MINIVRTVPWLLSNNRYIRESDKDLINVIDVLQSRVTTWTFVDFLHLYKDPTCKPLFNSLDYNRGEYCSVEDSLPLVVNFLLFQFGTDESL
jgi:hypothetical protein